MDASALKRYIYENGKVEYILEKIGCHQIRYMPSSDMFVCANYNGDNPTAVNVKNNIYLNVTNWTRTKEFSDTSDIITLTQYNKQCSFIDAVKLLHAIIGIEYTYETKRATNVCVQFAQAFINVLCGKKGLSDHEVAYIDETTLEDYSPILHIDWIRQGIIERTRKKFGLAFSYRKNRVIIPLRHWKTGKLLGTNSRTVLKDYQRLGIKKYFITPTYQKTLNLYGLYENMEDIKKANYVVVYEAEKSVLRRDSLRDPTGVAIQGHSMSMDQVGILIGLGVEEIIIAMDKDVPEDEVWYMCDKFYGVRKVSYIWDQYNLLGEKDSPADAPRSIFDVLFANRIVYDHEIRKKFIEMQKRG